MNKQKNAIVCNTPFQVLGAINIVVNKLYDGEFDLYLYGEFRNADSVYKNLKDAKIFNNIYYWKENKNRLKSRIHTFLKLTNRNWLLNDFIFLDDSFEKEYYQKIFIGDGNLIGIYLTKQNKTAELIFFDDGIATNVGNALFDTIGKFYLIFGFIFNLGVFKYKVSKLLVNNIAFCKSTITKNIEQLPFLTTENKAIDIAKNVFSFNLDSILLNKSVLYLGQPLEEKQGYNGMGALFFLNYIPELKNSFIVRAHPRQSVADFDGCEIDSINNMWELECMNSITDSHVLFGFCSTAQLMPKLLCNKEPYIVFLFKLFLDSFDSNEFRNDMEIYESIKSVYRDKDKVFLPESLDELKDFVEIHKSEWSI